MNHEEFSKLDPDQIESKLLEEKQIQLKNFQRRSKEFVANYDYSKICSEFKRKLSLPKDASSSYLMGNINLLDMDFELHNYGLLNRRERSDILVKYFNKVNPKFIFMAIGNPCPLIYIKLKSSCDNLRKSLKNSMTKHTDVILITLMIIVAILVFSSSRRSNATLENPSKSIVESIIKMGSQEKVDQIESYFKYADEYIERIDLDKIFEEIKRYNSPYIWRVYVDEHTIVSDFVDKKILTNLEKCHIIAYKLGEIDPKYSSKCGRTTSDTYVMVFQERH